jgi:hypothetical protein
LARGRDGDLGATAETIAEVAEAASAMGDASALASSSSDDIVGRR